MSIPVHDKVQTSMLLNLSDPAFRADPYPTYARLRATAPITRVRHAVSGEAWLITRYDDVQRALRDPALTTERKRASAKLSVDNQRMPRLFAILQNIMLLKDDPEHRRLRDLVHMAFTPRMIEQMENRIEAVTHQLLDGLAAQSRPDLLNHFTRLLPLTIISDMMGVPERRRHAFGNMTNQFLNMTNRSMIGMMLGVPNAMRMYRFFQQLVALRRAEPGDDLVSGLVRVEMEGDRLDEEEMVGTIFLLLLAGYETTMNLIATGMLGLMEQRDQMDRLAADPTLMDKAVEELLRWSSPTEQATPRFVADTVEYGGQTVNRGETVWVAIASANRDEAVFPNPDAINVGRTPNKHLSFGYGIHYCLGAPLARLEGRVAFRALLDRFPNMRPAVPAEQLQWRNAIAIRGLEALPVRLN